MNEIQLSNSPSLFLTLPRIGYLKEQIAKSERTMKGDEFVCPPLYDIFIQSIFLFFSSLGMSFFAKRSLHLLESMFKIENMHVMEAFLHPE